MSNKLKPVAYIHYWIGGLPPDGYSEESELLMPYQIEKYKGMVNSELEGITPLYAIPEGYALVPLSTNSKQKYNVIGEFEVGVDIRCPECDDMCECEEDCGMCEGEGEIEHKVTIPWTTCKDIYTAMIESGKLAIGDNNEQE